MEKMSSIIRREFKKGDDIRDAGLTAPDDVIRYKDIAYGKDSAMQVLDVYRPKDTEGNLPVIVSVHGGGWVYGDKELYQYYCMSIAQRGFAVVNFTGWHRSISFRHLWKIRTVFLHGFLIIKINMAWTWRIFLQWAILPVDRFFHCMQISVRMQSMQKNMISRYRKD